MKVTTERLDNCQIDLIIEVDAAEIDKKMRETARKISRRFAIPGYRKGKAPFYAVVRTFGREAIQQQLLEEVGDRWYEEALEQIDYEPYDIGQLQKVEWDPFRMVVRLPIAPEVELGDYRSVRVPFEKPEITDEQVEQELAKYQEQFASWVPVERPARMGDQVVLDMRGTVGETEVMNNEDYEMLLEEDVSYPMPGFHEQIVGMAPGEEKTFTLIMPTEGEDPEVAGKEATITVKVHSVKEKDVPPLDDDLALMVGDYDTLDDLKAATRESLESEALQEAEDRYAEKVLDAVMEISRIEYPPQAIDREAEILVNRMEANLRLSGITMERFLAMLGKTREAYKQDLYPTAEKRLRKRLVLVRIAEEEQLTVEEEEIDAEIARLRTSLDNPEDLRFLETAQGRKAVADDLLITRAHELLVRIASGEAPPPKKETPASPPEAEAPSDEAGEGGDSQTVAGEPEEAPASPSEAEAPSDEAGEGGDSQAVAEG